MKRYFRWPVLVLLVALVVAIAVPTFLTLQGTKRTVAHADTVQTPTMTLSQDFASPGDVITVTVTGLGADSSGYSVMWEGTEYLDSIYLNNGVYSGKIYIPLYILNGKYFLTAIDSAGNVAQADITIVPSMYVTPSSGGSGTSVSYQFNGLSASEVLQFYWEDGTTKTSLGSATARSWGVLYGTITIPATATPGLHRIIITRSAHPGFPLIKVFNFVAPHVGVTPGIHVGQSVNVHLSGFQGREQVSLSWDANGGQPFGQQGALGTDQTGAVTSTILPPNAPLGSYTLTATGLTSGAQATTSLTIGPGIALSSDTSIPGATITVTGGGFSANEALTVFFQDAPNTLVQVTTDANGFFSTPFAVSGIYRPDTRSIYAKNASATEHAHATFKFAAPLIYNEQAVPSYGQPFTYSGSGFAANEQVTIYWEYQQPGQFKLATLTADATGGFFWVTSIAPADNALSTITLAAIGKSSQAIATTQLTEYNQFDLKPLVANVGVKVYASIGSFVGNETVTITVGGTLAATVQANNNGAVKTTFVIPPTTVYGHVQVAAVGSTSGISITSDFYYTGTMQASASSGNPQIITVTGAHFGPSSSVSITIGTLVTTTVTTAADGTFTTTVPLQYLQHGKTYRVVAIYSNQPASWLPIAVAWFVA